MEKGKTSRSSRTESRCLIRSPCFTSYSFGLHDRSSYMPGCWCWSGVGLFCCLVLGYVVFSFVPATWLVTLSSLAQDDLCNLCTHRVSTCAKKEHGQIIIVFRQLSSRLADSLGITKTLLTACEQRSSTQALSLASARARAC